MITRYIVEIETARIGDEFSADWVQDVIKTNLENDTTQKVNVNQVKMPSEKEIIKEARGRAERHSIAEAELHKGLGNLYGYSRIENAEIASFEAGVEWLKSKIVK